jgi:signal transduction histidine kinase
MIFRTKCTLAPVAASPSSGPSPTTLRARLLALALLAVLPALGLVALTAKQNRDVLARQVEESSLRLARLTSGEHERAIEGARQLLTGLARIPEIQRGGPPCERLLEDLLVRFPTYANFGVADLKGDVFCSSVETRGTVSIADRSYFRGAVSGRDFTIGDFQIGRITNVPTLNFGYPILDRLGRTRSVVFAALSLESLSDVIARAGLPSGSSTIVLDGKGVILARSPDPGRFVGRAVPDNALARGMRASESGTADLAGPDGVDRVYGWVRLRGGGAVSVAVGVPSATAFAEVNRTYWRTLVALAGVGLLALAAAWYVGTLFIVRPVTRAIELERQARERLELVDKMRSDFVSMVSHELRNPMATIRGFAQILEAQEDSLPAGKRRETYEVIVRQVDRMASLVDNVLEVSRMESDSFSYAFRPYDLRSLLAECVEEARAGWPAHTITLDAPNGAPAIRGDRDRIKQVMLNLVSNACRYSPDGSPVVVRAAAGGSSARIDVVDEGVGIAAEHQSMLFQRFARVRTPDTANVRGTGLGLYISRRIVEVHGGTITVASEPGRGSTFSVTLPLEPPRPPATRSESDAVI